MNIIKINTKNKAKKLEKLKEENFKLRKKIAENFKKQMYIEWSIEPVPEWFDHYIDLYSSWGWDAGNAYWVERGCYNILAIKENANILELCCGDGFNSKYFYSSRARKIDSIDFDPAAIKHANKYNKKSNINFICSDIRKDLPDNKYDNVIWDAAIEHFTESEIKDILKKIKNHLVENGMLSGYTIVAHETSKYFSLHEYEFKSKEDLLEYLNPYFKNIMVFETIYEDRHNLYFYASDGLLPFSKDWKHMVSK